MARKKAVETRKTLFSYHDPLRAAENGVRLYEKFDDLDLDWGPGDGEEVYVLELVGTKKVIRPEPRLA